MSSESVLSRAAQWFLRSGIQDASGGVARYYRTDLERNHPVSTEITGYAVSTLLYLDRPEAALAAARYLCRAWTGSAMPFEVEPGDAGLFTYFFDCGIIVRGLLGAWRETSRQEFLSLAVALGKAMMTDFATAECEYHPILKLPSREPLPHDAARWSQAPGCYQLKSALAWREVFEATRDAQFNRAYECFLGRSLRSYAAFLPGHPDPLKVVDRLHAFLYFLEGMLPRAEDPDCAAALCDGIRRVAACIEDAGASFERSDVYAQLLRVRVYAAWAGAVPLDRAAAEREAAVLGEFQASSADPRIDGGFYFGRKSGEFLPYVNPVSTGFGLQALSLWEQYRGGAAPVSWRLLI